MSEFLSNVFAGHEIEQQQSTSMLAPIILYLNLPNFKLSTIKNEADIISSSALSKTIDQV